jgi:hypothetical protein
VKVWIKLPVDRTVQARLLVTGHTSKVLTIPLSASSLEAAARGATALTIISAFYDVRWCKELLVSAGVANARLVVNGLGGARLVRQKRELCKLQKEVAAHGIELDARLAFAPGIFHSKLIVIDRGPRSVAFIGSANATAAAMARNEEIMLRLTGDLRDLVGYADRICKDHSTDARDIPNEHVPRSLIAFFRSGSLYFKSATSLQLTLHPFKDIELRLTREQKVQLGSVKLRHAEGKTGIGPFSIVKALQLGGAGRAAQAKINPFAIETSLGYWVPDKLRKQLRIMLKRASRSKRKAWTARREMILGTPLKEARQKYKEYIEDIREVLARNRIDLAKLLGKGEDPFALGRFDGFYKSIRRRLKNDVFFERLTDPFHRAAVPEIWDDRVSRLEFEDSFFRYLEFTASLARCPRVPRTVLRQLRGAPTSASAIKAALRKRLKRGWESQIWV